MMNKACLDCGIDISMKLPQAKRCKVCAKEHLLERTRRTAKRIYDEKSKTHSRTRRSRNSYVKPTMILSGRFEEE